MCFDLSDEKLMLWSLSIGSCANMRYPQPLLGNPDRTFQDLSCGSPSVVLALRYLCLGSKCVELTKFLFCPQCQGLKCVRIYKIIVQISCPMWLLHSTRSPLVTYTKNGWYKSIQKFNDQVWPVVKLLDSKMGCQQHITILPIHIISCLKERFLLCLLFV